MQELRSNTAGDKEWQEVVRTQFVISTYFDIGSGSVEVIGAAPEGVDERRGMSYVSLSGLERWEAEHGLDMSAIT